DLIKKGYLPIAKGATPDFLVAFHVHTQQKTEVQDWGYSAPSWWWGAGPDVTVYQYSEGTLFVDFIDPRTNKVIWRGTAKGVVKDPENPDLGKLADAVNKLMQNYPQHI